MHEVEPLAIVVVKVQKPIICLVDLMNEEMLVGILGLGRLPPMCLAKVFFISNVIGLEIKSMRPVLREHAHQLIEGREVRTIQVSSLHINLPLIIRRV